MCKVIIIRFLWLKLLNFCSIVCSVEYQIRVTRNGQSHIKESQLRMLIFQNSYIKLKNHLAYLSKITS